MKWNVTAVVGLALLLLPGAPLGTAASAQDYGDDGKIDTFGGCQETIPPAIRTAIVAAATTQAQMMLAGDYEGALRGRTEENKTKVSVADTARSFEPTLSVLRPYRNTLTLGRVDYSVTGGEGRDRMVYCTVGGEEVKLHLAPQMTQGHVQFALRTPNNEWAVSEWLFLENGAWRVEHFAVNPSSVGDVTPQKLADIAEKEVDAGRLFNANVLYRGALRYASRGMSIRLAVTEDVSHLMQHLPPLAEFADKSPRFWTLNGHAYVAAQVDVVAMKGQMALSVAVGTSQEGDKAVAHLHTFVDDLLATFPEIRRVFPIVVVTAVTPGFDARCIVILDDVASRCTYSRAIYRVGRGFDKG